MAQHFNFMLVSPSIYQPPLSMIYRNLNEGHSLCMQQTSNCSKVRKSFKSEGGVKL